jgi:hypothetical protein
LLHVPFFQFGKAKGNFVSEIPVALPVTLSLTKDYKMSNEFVVLVDIIQCIDSYFRNISDSSLPASVKNQLNITHELAV